MREELCNYEAILLEIGMWLRMIITRHAMMNWQMEGSNDKQDWCVLDKRMHLWEEDENMNKKYENQRKILCQKGQTSHWVIDSDEIMKYEKGHRYFRIMQTCKNSNSSDNMSLSGLELYGCPIGEKWNFL